MLAVVAAVACAGWLGLLLTPWQPWRNREQIAPQPAADDLDLHGLTVLIPARNEAAGIGRTLSALHGACAAGARVLVVDDQSDDRTAALVTEQAARDPHIRLLAGQPRPAGWSGKLWAQQQGLTQIDTDLVLLLDADIEIDVDLLPALVEQLRREQRAFVSVMATFALSSLAERVLMPPFVYFFRLLYPFALANDSRSVVAAAAGGCVLVRRSWLTELGAFEAIRGELIDDCALAAVIKRHGGRGWTGLSTSVRSHRPNGSLATIGNMVARNAFTQLGHSVALLLACTAIMLVMFVGPLAGLVWGGDDVRLLSLGALLAMAISYLPTLSFYRGSPLWVLSLPLAGCFYLSMTWLSAWRYWRGRQSHWRGRVYETGFGA